MATRRCLKALVRHCNSVLSSNPSSVQTLKSLAPHLSHTRIPIHACQSRFALLTYLRPNSNSHFVASRHFCTSQGNRSGDDDDASGVESCDDDDASEVDNFNDERASGSILGNEDKEKEAADIGYKVIGPLEESDLVFKPYEPAFAVVQVGSHQFKVSNEDSIFTEKLKYCDVNDKLILNKVLMLGSKTQTIIGRPLLADAAVHAVVEEHALNAKVIIFKKKRRKNYRRTKGHRQELTKLRITNIQGIEKPEITVSRKTEKTVIKEVEKVAVAA